MKSRLAQHRQSLTPAPTVADVARSTGINRSTIYRIEAGEVAPTRSNARALFEYYRGRVSIADIYDPEFAEIERQMIAPKGAAAG